MKNLLVIIALILITGCNGKGKEDSKSSLSGTLTHYKVKNIQADFTVSTIMHYVFDISCNDNSCTGNGWIVGRQASPVNVNRKMDVAMNLSLQGGVYSGALVSQSAICDNYSIDFDPVLREIRIYKGTFDKISNYGTFSNSIESTMTTGQTLILACININ